MSYERNDRMLGFQFGGQTFQCTGWSNGNSTLSLTLRLALCTTQSQVPQDRERDMSEATVSRCIPEPGRYELFLTPRLGNTSRICSPLPNEHLVHRRAQLVLWRLRNRQPIGYAFLKTNFWAQIDSFRFHVIYNEACLINDSGVCRRSSCRENITHHFVL